MTSEEVKQLKPGDEIFIRAKYKTVLGDGDVLFSHSALNGYDVVVEEAEYTHPGNVILPTELQPAPKYDPCRLFKKGDIVEPVERDGRDVPDGAPVREKCTVVESEKDGMVCIRYDAGSEHYIHEIPYFHLELVTPVEERSPYYVKEIASVYEVFNRNENNSSVAIFFKSQYSIEKAKERAEAECARLNAEYRKEQDNGNQ